MNASFPGLTTEENAKIIDAIPLITLLIGMADGRFDAKEKSWAERVTKLRTHSYNDDLAHFYQAVAERFDDRLNYFMAELPESTEDRTKQLSEKLGELDELIQKIEGQDSYLLYQDLLSFAEHVAKSSGGFLYMANVSPAERALLGLDMLTPIESAPGI